MLILFCVTPAGIAVTLLVAIRMENNLAAPPVQPKTITCRPGYLPASARVRYLPHCRGRRPSHVRCREQRRAPIRHLTPVPGGRVILPDRDTADS